MPPQSFEALAVVPEEEREERRPAHTAFLPRAFRQPVSFDTPPARPPETQAAPARPLYEAAKEKPNSIDQIVSGLEELLAHKDLWVLVYCDGVFFRQITDTYSGSFITSEEVLDIQGDLSVIIAARAQVQQFFSDQLKTEEAVRRYGEFQKQGQEAHHQQLQEVVENLLS